MTEPSHELNFRTNMKRARESQDVSQTDLARQMKDRGFGFHQQTVQRVESGDRPVRLNEAYAIAEILDMTVDELSRTAPAYLFFTSLIAAEKADARLVAAAGDFDRAVSELARAASEYEAEHGAGSLRDELIGWDLNATAAERLAHADLQLPHELVVEGDVEGESAEPYRWFDDGKH
jgi:transcriptional regulator with XRE-family HTH domain